MGVEIERKFLVKGDFKPFVTSSERIKQGYLSSDPARIVRVRTKGAKGYLTIKGMGSELGITRFEWEKEIEIADAESLLELSEPGIIDKTRYIVPEKSGLIFEVDVFYGENDGLVVAEIELAAESQVFHKPEWLGKEVTGISKYYNSSLMKMPFKRWK